MKKLIYLLYYIMSLSNLIDLAKNGKVEECYKIMSTIVPEYKKTKVENLQNKRVV